MLKRIIKLNFILTHSQIWQRYKHLYLWTVETLEGGSVHLPVL